MIRPPTAAATCTTSASIEASLEEGCPRAQDATRSAVTTANAVTPTAIRRPRESKCRMPSAFTASPEKCHPAEQSHDDSDGRTDRKLEGNHAVKGWSRKNCSSGERPDDADQCAQHPPREESSEQFERGCDPKRTAGDYAAHDPQGNSSRQ